MDLSKIEVRAQYIAGLRAAADLFETNEAIDIPCDGQRDLTNYGAHTMDNFMAQVAAMMPCSIVEYDSQFHVVKPMGGGLSIRAVVGKPSAPDTSVPLTEVAGLLQPVVPPSSDDNEEF